MSSLIKAVNWTKSHVADQAGKVYVITGANSGIGLEAARLLAFKDAKVIMACRSKDKALKAIDDLVNGVSEMTYTHIPSPIKVKRENLEFMPLDLADLKSVDRFPNILRERYQKIDCLVCNAGIMAPSKREETKQGFEMQMGVNVFGHYALVCRVAPFLQKSVEEGIPKPRVVIISSFAHGFVKKINFEDIDYKNSYTDWQIYGESKLGDLLLMEKFAEIYPQFVVAGCHPGYSATNLQDGTFMEKVNLYVAQAAIVGALPTVMAATDPKIKSKDFIGPYWHVRGLPTYNSRTKLSKDKVYADKLFQICQERVGLTAPSF